MWNSSSQCQICYNFLEITSDVAENQSDEERRKLLSVCREYLFNELCDWKTICHKETLPFCAECNEVIEKIKVLDGKLKSEKNDISDLSEQFTVKVLRLRNKRQRDEVSPKIIGGVTIKIEKGLEEEQNITCKICRGIYSEQSTGSLNLNMVAKVIRICKKYLFSEIFDDECLDVNVVARLNLLPFCFDCCFVIHEICQKSDSTESISAEIEKLVNRFAMKILNYRKNGKLIDKSEEIIIKVSLSPTPDHPLQNVTPPPGNEVESDEDCMIVDVLPPVGVERNILNALCKKLKGNKQTSPGETYTRQARTPEKIPFANDDVHYRRGGRFVGGTEASPPPPILEPMVDANSVTMNLNSSSLETGTVEGEEEPRFSEETPGPSKSTNRRHSNRNELGGNYKCQNCGAVFMNNFNWLSHIDSCFEGGKIFECETCGQCFADSLSFNKHVDSHETGNAHHSLRAEGLDHWNLLENENRRNFLQPENKLLSHPQIRSENKSYKCPRCSRPFARRNHLKNHLKGNVCLGGNSMPISHQKCFSRKRAQTSKKNSIIRMVKSTKGGIYTCTMCPLTFTHSIIFSKHIQTHYDIATIRCDFCRMVFNNTRSKAVHIYRTHSGNYQKRAKKNLKGYLSLGKNFRPISHKKVVYQKRAQTSKKNSIITMVKSTKGRIYTCTMCPFTSPNTVIFSKHIQTHYDIATIRCDFCRMVFNNTNSKAAHIYRTHSGKFQKNPKKNRNDHPTTQENGHLQFQRVHEDEVLKDSIQNQKDVQEEDLEQLEQQNYNDLADPEYSPKRTNKAKKYARSFTISKYTCSVCGMGFGGIMHLRHHLQTHYDEAPFRCTTCKRVLTNHRTLTRHMLNVHGIADY